MRGMPAPPPLALSPRAGGVRKRRGGPVSPGRGASRASLDTTVRKTEAALARHSAALQPLTQRSPVFAPNLSCYLMLPCRPCLSGIWRATQPAF